MLGQLLDTRYKLTKVLGGGGFSQTFIAEDTRRPGNPLCVVKHLKPAVTEPTFLETARRLFNTEAETLEKLGHHEQIPRLLAYFEEEREFYLVQELIEGHVLNAELLPGRRWTETQVVELLQEVLYILDFIHTKGVIHRDIKPSNIIRRQQDNKLVLVDFGTVKQIKIKLDTAQSQMSKSIAIGTVGYMPSEQVRGKPRPNSDIYALGIVGIQALTGLNPQDLEEDANGEVSWQSHAQVGDRLAEIIAKMVRYHFSARYNSAREVIDALESLNNPHAQPQATSHPGYAQTQLDPRPRYTPTRPATQPVTAPASSQVPQSTQQPTVFTSQNLSKQPTTELSPTPSSSQISPSSSGSNFITLIKSPLTITLGIAAALSIAATFALYINNQGGLKTALEEARKQAAIGRSVEAVATASKIPSDHPFYSQAQTIINNSSTDILKQATEIYEDSNDLTKAIDLAGTIPEQSTVYQEAQGKIYGWQKEAKTNKEYLNAAQLALDNNKWQNAIDEANKITYTPFWKKQKAQIIQQAKSEIEAAKPKEDTTASTNVNKQAPSPVYQQPAPVVQPPVYQQPAPIVQPPVYQQPAPIVQPPAQPPIRAANNPAPSTNVQPQTPPSPPPSPPSETVDTCSSNPDSFFCTN